ncbi:cold-regulated protein [Hordeum vulgare]|nr:cold-regulated protein [Hordeum vulgare]
MAQETLRLVCLPVSAHDGRLPRQYTLEGQGAKKDTSPPLEWYGVSAARVVANKSLEEKGLPEGFSGAGGNANTGGEGGLQEGVNDWKQPGWRGPVPDSHGHRVQFRLYALGDVLSLGNKAMHPLLQIKAAGVGGRGAAGWCRLMLKCTAMEQNQHMWWCRLMLKCTTMEQIRSVVVTSNLSRTAATSLAVLVDSGVALFFRHSSIALAYNESADPIAREVMSSHFSFFSTLLSL